MRFKKALSALLACTVVGTAAPVMSFNAPAALTAQASAEYTEGTYDVLTYYNYGDHIEITGCDQTATEVVIPEEIDGLPVTVIDNRAFEECYIESIIIPDSVTMIGGYAFKRCLSLTSITIPDSVTSIGDYAFEQCRSLTSIIIPDNVTRIGGYTFFHCSALTSITLPDSITSIGDYAFYNCQSLTSITIPDSVTSIGESAFLYCSALTSLTIPDSVTSISKNAFASCSALTSITIPDSVTSIGNGAFEWCEALTSITIPDGVTSIEDYAFYGCNSLTSITIPNSVTSIGLSAFSYCEALTSIAIINPDCVIDDSSVTISNEYDGEPYFIGTIYGYEGSTAQAYAEKYERTFIPLINGDADLDGELGIADVVKIMTHTTTPGGTLSEIEMINADVYQRGDGISNMDALAVQKKIAQLISELPESELDLV